MINKFLPQFYFLFGVLTMAGGLYGFYKADSRPSLVAGITAGVLLLIAGVLISSTPKVGLILGIIVSLALSGRFVPMLFTGHHSVTAIFMSVLSLMGVIWTGVVLIETLKL